MFVIKFPAPGVMEVTPLELSEMFHLKDRKNAEETQEQKNEKGEEKEVTQ